MKTARYTGDLHALLKWATNRRGTPPPEPFRSWVRDLMPPNCREHIGYHVGGLTPDSPLVGDWHKGYPHNHVTSVNWHPGTMTAITYLAVAQEGGEFGIGGQSKDDPYTFITPEPGLTIILDATIWHGVRRVIKGTRISLITGAPPNG